MLAVALGIDDQWIANAGKTGMIYLLDAETGKTLATLTKDHDFLMMCEKVDALLK